MGTNDVAARVKKAVAFVLSMQEEDISDEANFIFDLGADSLQSLELIAALEKEFNIKINKEEALALQTVKEAVAYIQSCMK